MKYLISLDNHTLWEHVLGMHSYVSDIFIVFWPWVVKLEFYFHTCLPVPPYHLSYKYTKVFYTTLYGFHSFISPRLALWLHVCPYIPYHFISFCLMHALHLPACSGPNPSKHLSLHPFISNLVFPLLCFPHLTHYPFRLTTLILLVYLNHFGMLFRILNNTLAYRIILNQWTLLTLMCCPWAFHSNASMCFHFFLGPMPCSFIIPQIYLSLTL